MVALYSAIHVVLCCAVLCCPGCMLSCSAPFCQHKPFITEATRGSRGSLCRPSSSEAALQPLKQLMEKNDPASPSAARPSSFPLAPLLSHPGTHSQLKRDTRCLCRLRRHGNNKASAVMEGLNLGFCIISAVSHCLHKLLEIRPASPCCQCDRMHSMIPLT